MCPIMNFLFGQQPHHQQEVHNFFGMPYQPKFQPRNSMLEAFSIEGPIGTLIILAKVIFATYMAIAQEMVNYTVNYIQTYKFELATGLWDVAASSFNLTFGLFFADFLGGVAYKPLKLSTELDYPAIAEYADVHHLWWMVNTIWYVIDRTIKSKFNFQQ